jgi:TRAP transporter 4TM/12TM fusion protein
MIKKNGKALIISVTAICWSLIQLYNAATFDLDIFQIQIVHLTFALALVFLLKPIHTKSPYLAFWDYPLTAMSVAVGVYFFSQYGRIIERMRFSDPVYISDILMGTVLIVLLLEAGRRILGIALSLLGILSILYAFFGFLLPGPLAHQSVDIYNFIEFMVLTEEGIFGVPLRVSATFVFLFILFGAFLKYGRLGEVYNDLALSVAGGLRGGPAKVAVISSGLFGTISGSATANVSTSGTFTIPMMVNNGYSPISAGAIEALASTGSQLVPPIMGAAAFIMAELTGISYWHIAKAAIIPSILYYFVVYLAIHYEAIDMGLKPYQGPKTTLLHFVLKKTYMFIPIFVIIFFMATGHTIILSAMLAIVSCFLIGVVTILFTRKWKDFTLFLKALEDGARNSVNVAIPCALAGLIVGVLTLSGLGIKFSSIIIGVASGNRLILLIVTSIICLILGMGMPSSAAYITVAVLAIPALVKIGFSTLTAHFFGFYFANLSMITPPIALASYTAAGIAVTNPTQVSYRACFIGMALYVIPFLFVTYPSLLLEGSGYRIVLESLKAATILVCLCSVYMGRFRRKLNRLEKLLFMIAMVCLWAGQKWGALNAVGLLCFGFGAWHNIRLKRAAEG